MSNYPMTYEEYEKKVIDLFINMFPEDKQEIMLNRLNDALEDDPCLIKGLYGDDCFCYDNPELYGKNCENIFEEDSLLSGSIRILDMLIGGNFD